MKIINILKFWINKVLFKVKLLVTKIIIDSKVLISCLILVNNNKAISNLVNFHCNSIQICRIL